ncbi:16S rRNA (guanine(527)-N(7))-methyltransferase RsmG [Pseudohaliea rubra]|uniref:Ribosomal RNA small subunit methyltransferase G n=1 Tax=Pseudohaliea rubra DSM 19751 TaxID=1265313 RepID=A0A095X0L2_9GAMM|nr:16S rRNA (guanine(527)-N(7))-methyltransferase RsmG [Pseudohaliea rubra]KGE04439.1 rRNA small subunit methyltransferase, glucose inhibited division protein GidB [Pseudohaliea rubra DSM 19751]
MRDPALAAGCAALGLRLPPATLAALSSYLDLLEKWNRAYNLTAVRTRDAMVTRHLLDSLALLPHLPVAGSFIDVGTGPGLPGVPLALCAPERAFCLLDSNGKKTRFLFQVKTALALANIRIASERAEDHRPEGAYAGILSRAFAALPAMVESCRHFLAPGGAFYAMKAQVAAEELAAAEALGYRATVTALVVPGLDEQRSLITLRPETSA